MKDTGPGGGELQAVLLRQSKRRRQPVGIIAYAHKCCLQGGRLGNWEGDCQEQRKCVAKIIEPGIKNRRWNVVNHSAAPPQFHGCMSSMSQHSSL